jgi:hypothetical protein
MGWKSVELQIEALIPGILLLVEAHALAISWFGFRATTLDFVPTADFQRAAFFVAAAYSVGVVSSLLSRALVDGVSERGPRGMVFAAFAHHELRQAIDDCRKNDSRFASDHERETRNRLSSTVASWNAVYRSALRRTTRRDEVDRRRSQGRFFRNLLLPLLGVPLIVLRGPWSVLAALVTGFVFVFVYAYAEYVNLAEAYDISEATPK